MPMPPMIGRSISFLGMTRLVGKVAACDAPVLVEGETGTGKELVARAIHYLSARRENPFIPVNCGAIPDTLVESELFGHQKGAFTDAKTPQPGLVCLAKGGTLFLDEVDALTPKGQVTLLRFLQDQEYRPLGSGDLRKGDVRVITASNADLSQLACTGAFRLDLLFRLRILYLRLDPLRDRQGDVALLAQHFLAVCEERFHQGRKTLHPETQAWMERHSWPGNVRELEHFIYREYLLADGAVIRAEIPESPQEAASDDLEACLREPNYRQAKAQAMANFERTYLARLLDLAEGNVSLAARLAGKERRSLGKLLKKYGLSACPPRSRTLNVG